MVRNSLQHKDSLLQRGMFLRWAVTDSGVPVFLFKWHFILHECQMDQNHELLIVGVIISPYKIPQT